MKITGVCSRSWSRLAHGLLVDRLGLPQNQRLPLKGAAANALVRCCSKIDVLNPSDFRDTIGLGIGSLKKPSLKTVEANKEKHFIFLLEMTEVQAERGLVVWPQTGSGCLRRQGRVNVDAATVPSLEPISRTL